MKEAHDKRLWMGEREGVGKIIEDELTGFNAPFQKLMPS